MLKLTKIRQLLGNILSIKVEIGYTNRLYSYYTDTCIHYSAVMIEKQ